MTSAPPSAARVVVCVVTFNSKRYWSALHAALEAQTFKGFNLVIVDNASRPEERLGACDLPAGVEIRQLERNIGFAAANNVAAGKAEFFVTLNPDAFPDPDWLARLVEAADANPSVAAFGSMQIDAQDETQLDGAGDEYWIGGLPYRSLYARPRSRHPGPGRIFSACAAAALYRGDAFRAAGGFDEDFFCYCEDVDLGFRLRLMGYESIEAPGAMVRHVGGGTASARSSFAVYHGARNRIWTFVRSMPGLWFYLLAPVHIALTLFVMVWSLFRGTARATWGGVGAALAGLPRAWKKRMQTQRARVAGDFAVLSATMFSPLAVVRRAPKRG
jgi:N-acetylglucosaminyl-diphospho-decaprenol L-rhamnosyltransferase